MIQKIANTTDLAIPSALAAQLQAVAVEQHCSARDVLSDCAGRIPACLIFVAYISGRALSGRSRRRYDARPAGHARRDHAGLGGPMAAFGRA